MNINYFFNKEFSFHINEKKKFSSTPKNNILFHSKKKKKKPNQIKSEIWGNL